MCLCHFLRKSFRAECQSQTNGTNAHCVRSKERFTVEQQLCAHFTVREPRRNLTISGVNECSEGLRGGGGKSRSCAYCRGRGDVSALALTNCLMIILFFYFFFSFVYSAAVEGISALFYFLIKDGVQVQEQ